MRVNKFKQNDIVYEIVYLNIYVYIYASSLFVLRALYHVKIINENV